MRTNIDKNWQFSLISDLPNDVKTVKRDEWLDVASFPTTVHVELLKQKKIVDPFVGLNEWDVQWVGEANWAFKTSFDVDQSTLQSQADLVFEGLDTYTNIILNGKQLHETSNQFISYRVSIRDAIKSGQNELVIEFPSAFVKGRQLERQYGKLNLWNGDSSRLHVRKAQYNYGWDWGPVLMTVGPWRPIYFETYDARIQDLRVSVNVVGSLGVIIDTAVQVDAGDGSVKANLILKDPSGAVVREAKDVSADSNGHFSVSWKAEPGEFKLWYPVGYGAQPLYTVEVQISQGETVVDNCTQRVGLRRARVVQDELEGQSGRSFLFEINKVRIFCGGSNWIPADSFLTTLTPEVYRAWLQLLVDGNQNMIRVWGGGIYEHDVFYDLCDEMGILVWQDFMFGCGQYPAYDSFLDSVKLEAEQNIARIRHHPSLVIFAGNNEDYQVAESLKLDLNYDDETSDFRKTNFPARHIYERLLPEVVERLSDVHYHRSSPYSGFGKVTTDRTYGDLHQWNVWHGTQEPWHNWDKLSGRFVSEFGMEAYPNIRTVDYWLNGQTEERYPQSRVMNSHNKADGFERRLELYLVENFEHSFDLDSYVYYTQVMQAETLASAYRLWRREWRGLGREYTAGALVWQINDCWPVTSWAIVDYFLRPKPAYFTIARELRPYTVGMTRKEEKKFANADKAADFTIDTVLEIWGTNSTLSEKTVKLDVTAFDLHSDWTEFREEETKLASNSSTELFKGSLPGQPLRSKLSEVPKTIVVSTRLLDENGAVLARYSNWPEPFKFIQFPSEKEVGLSISTSSDGESVTLSSKKPVKGIVLDIDGDDVKWSDQAIDLVPGDPQTVRAVGLKGRAVKARFLGDRPA